MLLHVLGAVRAGLELKRAFPYEMCVQRGFDSMPRLVVIDGEAAEPMAAFVMFAGHGGESGATVARRLRLATRRGVDRR